MDLENDRRGTWWKGNVRGRGSVGAVSSRSYSVCRIAKNKILVRGLQQRREESDLILSQSWLCTAAMEMISLILGDQTSFRNSPVASVRTEYVTISVLTFGICPRLRDAPRGRRRLLALRSAPDFQHG